MRESLIPQPAAHQAQTSQPKVSVVIPCLDEADSIEQCVRLAHLALEEHHLDGEVVVADNGSSDGSAELARRAGARVVHEPRRGYGNACLAGLGSAQGEYLVMADADLTYDFADIPRFVAALDAGAELVIGDRMDSIYPGAMPWLHRYVGNPVLTGILNLFYRTGVKDAHCGMRAVRADVLGELDLHATGMEFASEMVIRASKQRLRISQLAIKYHPRQGLSKLSRVGDGWRHLRFLLVHSPTHLFMLPGGLMAATGALVMAIVPGRIDVLGGVWQLHGTIAGALLLIVGVQVISLGLCAQAYGAYFMGERDPWFNRMRGRFRLEHGLLLGGAVSLVGLTMGAGLGGLREERFAVVAATLVIVGIQIFFASFLLSILGLRRRRHGGPGGKRSEGVAPLLQELHGVVGQSEERGVDPGDHRRGQRAEDGDRREQRRQPAAVRPQR